MPRPPDHYTHGQFAAIETEDKTDLVRCLHCKEWTGGAKTLNRKKEHLLKCPSYLAWRAAGNGQDLQPANSYNKRPRDSTGPDDEGHESSIYPSQYTPSGAARNKYPEMGKFFDEFWDDTNGQKCMRVRCLACGYVRAKNTTRQYEHLQNCQNFLRSTEGQQALANGDLEPVNARVSTSNHTDSAVMHANGDIWNGGAPNPNLAGMSSSSSNTKGPKHGNKGGRSTNLTPFKIPATKVPSMINHLLSKNSAAVAAATQQQFLSQAGCGKLSASALTQWLAQEIHISRALIPFVGSLIGKIRVPETDMLQYNSIFRATDLLCSAVNNTKKELEFIEATKQKYQLLVMAEEPQPATKGIIDMLQSASSAQASLLEGLVVLWSIEHLFCVSFQYAGNFISTMASSSSYSLPSYLTARQPGNNLYGEQAPSPDDAHISALHDSFIQNWTSANYIRFVEACKAIVDELANAQTSGNGAQEMMACERSFRQSVWLWGQIWPDVSGTGEEDELTKAGADISPVVSKTAVTEISNGNASDRPLNIVDDDGGDDDAEGEINSPFAGTGLGAVQASNRA